MAVKFGSGTSTGTPLISGTTGITPSDPQGFSRAVLSFWFQYTGAENSLVLAKFTGPDIEVQINQTDVFSGTVLSAILRYNGTTLDTLYFHNYPSGRLTIGDWYHLAVFIDSSSDPGTKNIPISVYFGSTLADSGAPSTGQSSVLDYNITDIEMVERGSTTYDVAIDRLYVGLKKGTEDYDPDDYYVNPPQFYLNFYDSLGRAALLGDDNLQDEFTDDTPYYWLTDSGTSFGTNDSNCSGNNLTVDANATTITGPDSHNLLSSGAISLSSQTQLTASATYGVFGSSSISADNQLDVSGNVTKGITETLSSTTKATDFTTVQDYVETEEALYVDAGYHDDGYVENDPYVADGYVGEELGLSAEVLVNAELDATGQGAITITAKATLASEVDFATQTAMSVSAGLVFSQATSIAADTAQTQTVGLIFSQSTDLAADFVSSQLGGNIIVASATPASDAQISATTDVLQGGILDATASSDISIVPGYKLDGTASVATDAQVSADSEVIPFIDETFESDFALSATGTNDIVGELDVSGQGAISITASATTGSDVELNGSFQFSAIAELDVSADTSIASDAQTSTLGGLVFSQITNIASDFATTQTGGITTNSEIDITSDSEFAIDSLVLIGSILDASSEFAVPNIQPNLFVGGVSDIFQGTSTVVTIGSYVYDVPLIRRLTVPADSRTANILQETGILGVKSESRINTVIQESRALKVPQDDRTHKIYDGSL